MWILTVNFTFLFKSSKYFMVLGLWWDMFRHITIVNCYKVSGKYLIKRIKSIKNVHKVVPHLEQYEEFITFITWTFTTVQFIVPKNQKKLNVPLWGLANCIRMCLSLFCNVMQLLKYLRKIFNGVASYYAMTLWEKSVYKVHILTPIS